MKLTPVRKLYTKAWMTFATITTFVAAGAGVATLIINLAADDPGQAVPIMWIVVGSALAAMWIIGAPIAWLWIRNLSYEVTADEVIIHKGILSKVDQNIPFRMITDFRLHRSLYDRWLHIGSIDVQTAGQNQTATGYEGRIAGQHHPAELHQELRNRIRRLEPHHDPATGNGGTTDLHALLEEVREIHHLLER
jgi:putative membrane protein